MNTLMSQSPPLEPKTMFDLHIYGQVRPKKPGLHSFLSIYMNLRKPKVQVASKNPKTDENVEEIVIIVHVNTKYNLECKKYPMHKNV